MFRFHFYGFPYNYPYYTYYNNSINNVASNSTQESKDTKNSITNCKIVSNTINQNSDNMQPLFEILGIKLYMDDLIIVGLLYFLYQQGVKDEMLYIVLFLLLFS